MSGADNPYPDFTSGEFDLHVSRPGSNAFVIFDGHAWLLGHGNTNEMWQTTFQLEPHFTQRVAQHANWTSHAVQPPDVPGGMSPYRHCGADVSAGTQPGLYLFWVNQNGGRLLASCCPPGSGGGAAWGSALILAQAGGNTEIKPHGDVGATAFGDDTFLVATIGTSDGLDGTGLFIGAYDTNDIASVVRNGWPARSQLFLGIAQLENLLGQVWAGARIDDIGPNCTLAWSSSVASGSAKPSFYVTVFIKATVRGTKGQVSLPLCVPLDEKADLGSAFFLKPLVDTTWAPVSVARDPAGRLLAFTTFGAPRKQLGRYLYATDAVLQPDQGPTSGSGQDAAGVDGLPPTVGYFIDTSAQPDPCPPGSTESPTYPVYQLAFYGKDVRCQVDYFGYIQVECGCVQNSLVPETAFVLNGLIAGPVPVPNQNIAGYSFAPGTTSLGAVAYGATETTETSHQASVAWTLGFQSSGHSTKGVGPAWNISFKSGCGSVTGDTSGTTMSVQKTQQTNIDKTAGNVGTGVVPAGNIFAAPMTIVATLYKFFDAQGNVISDGGSGAEGQAMKSVLIQVVPGVPGTYPYTPFLVTPGELESYTPEAINARMNSKLPFLKTPKLVGKRSPPWNDYFMDVICANAYLFPNGDKYLSFSWSYDGEIASQFQATATSFTESTWTLDASFYAGISGGEGIQIFGMGENTQYQFLAGVTVTANTMTKTAEGNSWGVAINNWNAPGWGDPSGSYAANHHAAWLDAIAAYSFLMILLPPPAADSDFGANYWAAELKDLLPTVDGQTFTRVADIDPNSGTWKIVFVVTQYATNRDWFYNSQSWTYQYTGPLPRAETKASSSGD